MHVQAAAEQQAVMVQPPEPRAPAAAPHPLFTQLPATAPAHRPSLFGKVTGAFRRGGASAPAEQEVPDLRRPDLRVAPVQAEPATLARTSLADSEPVGLDIPAFLRRQSS